MMDKDIRTLLTEKPPSSSDDGCSCKSKMYDVLEGRVGRSEDQQWEAASRGPRFPAEDTPHYRHQQVSSNLWPQSVTRRH